MNIKKALAWVVILALIILAVRLVSAQAIRAVPQGRQAVPAMVFWHTDSAKITSVGWLDIIGDSVIIIKHIRNDGEANNMLAIPKSAVDSISLLKPVQTAVLKKPPNGG